ncbi:MAG: glycoside hydrolase family 44 protein [Chryseolinea sp.]
MRILVFTFLLCAPFLLLGQVTVTVDLSKESHLISPYLYGRNNSLSGDPGSAFTPEWKKLKDARVRFFRESGGNNSTKYNWRLKISSHPDWYNNVYANDWSFAAQSLQQNIPDAQGMWAFQLIGKAAMTNTANFNDWGYNSSQWWEGVNQNLAGGGEPKTSGGTKALKEGNPDLYLQNWNADSTTLILNHWFNDLSLHKEKLQYWNMDNEVEIWNGTHDDVMPTQITAEQFMQRYFEVAKKARERYPAIKLVGPVTANEWQWYNWPTTISSGGKNYPWLEYFIKRVAEEQTASGVRLLDVLDIHFYPGSSTASEVVQYHRVFFDKTYVYPEANGVKNVSGSWDNTQTKEYIFERCKVWLDQYMGTGHGVTFGVTETGISNINASTTAVWYASTLGEFMKHQEMEIFTPWTWSIGMWEVLHLYSRYNKTSFVPATSTEEEFVSAYPTINEAGDSLSVVLVNRSVNATKSVNLNLNGFDLDEQPFNTLKLSSLSASETFISHTSNALQKSTVNKSGNSISISLAPLSITTIQLKGQKGDVVTGVEDKFKIEKVFNIYPNPAAAGSKITIEIHKAGNATVDLIDTNGRILKTVFEGKTSSSFKKEIELSEISKGTFVFRLNINGEIFHKKVFTF